LQKRVVKCHFTRRKSFKIKLSFYLETYYTPFHLNTYYHSFPYLKESTVLYYQKCVNKTPFESDYGMISSRDSSEKKLLGIP
jgi:hypothetical protein